VDNLINIQQASRLTGLSIPTLYKYICMRRVPYIKLGGRVLFDRKRLEGWIHEHSVEPIGSMVKH